MLLYYGLLHDLQGGIRDCQILLQKAVRGKQPTDILPYPVRGGLEAFLSGIEAFCARFEIKPALDRLNRIRTEFKSPMACSYLSASNQFKTLLEVIEDELKDRNFFYLPKVKQAFLDEVKDIPLPATTDKDDLQFARKDWFEAGQCYLYDRDTACIMHLMRVIEVGLRILGRHVGPIELKRAIEFEDWKPILIAVEKKIGQLENDPRTAERALDLSFYSDAAKQLNYFKHIWRDGSAHARDFHDEHEARRALEHVREFMTLLAEKLQPVTSTVRS